MKKRLVWILLAAALAALAFASCFAEGETAEWTVLVYLCGSDLESKYEYASLNLKEISHISYPYYLMPLYTEKDVSTEEFLRDVGRVNILIETGGSSEWHSQDLNIDVSPDALQRWRYNYFPLGVDGEDQAERTFRLMETLPLQSMADSEQLTDFLRWGMREFPAKKYALVLWGHGGSAETGLLVDELYDGDLMYQYELQQALRDSGIYLEALIADACQLASLETAWSVRDCAHWLVASEEIVPGEGSAFGDWLQALVNHPALDGEWLGQCICNMTEEKYSNLDNDFSRQTLTWSVIDLTKIDRMITAFGKMIQVLNNSLTEKPEATRILTRYLLDADRYGDSRQNLRDLGSVLYNPEIVATMDLDLLNEAIDALSDAVVYVSRGSGRTSSRGLSFCYPAGDDPDKLDTYAKSFPMPHYLAWLDAISDWEAPEWIYEYTERLPEIDTIDALQVTIEKRMAVDGLPALYFGNTNANVNDIFYTLYGEDPSTGTLQLIGRSDCIMQFSEQMELLWEADDLLTRPAIEGEFCCMDLVDNSNSPRLYNIPIQINSDIVNLRCGQIISYAQDGTRNVEYEIYGVWEGYDADSDLPNRNVERLAIMAGREYRLLFPLGTDRAGFAYGPTRTVPRALSVKTAQLPAATYCLQYEVRDLFMRTTKLEMIKFAWDGQTITYPDGFTWEGMVEPEWDR